MTTCIVWHFCAHFSDLGSILSWQSHRKEMKLKVVFLDILLTLIVNLFEIKLCRLYTVRKTAVWFCSCWFSATSCTNGRLCHCIDTLHYIIHPSAQLNSYQAGLVYRYEMLTSDYVCSLYCQRKLVSLTLTVTMIYIMSASGTGEGCEYLQCTHVHAWVCVLTLYLLTYLTSKHKYLLLLLIAFI